MRIACALLILSTGCGLGFTSEPSGGSDHLPTLGAGPYGKPDVDFDTPADEPFVVSQVTGSLLDPAVLRRDDGGFRFWFGRQPNNVFDESEIWRAEIPTVFDLPDVLPTAALQPDQAWEDSWVAAPAIVEGDDGRLVMYYEGGLTTRAIGRAESVDGGATWTKDPANPLIVDAGEPTVARVDGTWLLYLTQPGRDGIFRATSADGVTFAIDDQPVVAARPDLADAFDRGGVSDPFVLVEETAAGRLHYGLFFNGSDGEEGEDEDIAIGFAGSFDGVVFERFNGPEPVLTPGNPIENGPAAVVESDRGFLFYHQESGGRQRIGVALHP
jgi:hypothetical protein